MQPLNDLIQLAPTVPSSTSLLGWFGPAWTTPSPGLHGLITTEENTELGTADEVTTDFPLLFFTTNAEIDILETTNNQLTTNQSNLNILNKDDIQITEDVQTTAQTLISDQGIFNTQSYFIAYFNSAWGALFMVCIQTSLHSFINIHWGHRFGYKQDCCLVIFGFYRFPSATFGIQKYYFQMKKKRRLKIREKCKRLDFILNQF